MYPGPFSFDTPLVAWICRLAEGLDQRNAWRLLPILTGLLFASGRRTVASWLRAGGMTKSYQDNYYFLGSLGSKVNSLAREVFRIALAQVGGPQRILLAIDDTPSKRYGT